MALPKPPYSYEMAMAAQQKGYNYVCTGCRETYTIYPKGEAFNHTCWCGATRSFTGREIHVEQV